MKKALAVSLFAVLFMFTLSSPVHAEQYKYYDADIPAMNNGYLPWTTAWENNKYALNYVIDRLGSAVIHTYYQTNYNNKAYTVGGELSINSNYQNRALVWYPTGNNSNPGGYTIHARKSCSGNNTTSSWCVVASEQYRLRLQKRHVFSSFSVYGALVFTN